MWPYFAVYLLIGCGFAVLCMYQFKKTGAKGPVVYLGSLLSIVLWPYFLVIAIYDS